MVHGISEGNSATDFGAMGRGCQGGPSSGETGRERVVTLESANQVAGNRALTCVICTPSARDPGPSLFPS